MQLSVARTTRTTTTTTSGRDGKFSSGTSPSLFVVRRRRIRRSEREAKRTNATPRALFNNNNDDGKRTRRAKPKPLQQGDLTKKRCDACLGTGKIPCYNCTRRTSGWESGGAGNASGGVKAISVADKVGYVPAKKKKTKSLFSLPFGWKTTTTTTTDESDSKN